MFSYEINLLIVLVIALVPFDSLDPIVSMYPKEFLAKAV